MKPLLRPLVIATALSLSFATLLVACSKPEEPPAAMAAAKAQPFETVRTLGKGFTVGALMSTNTVYVLFDPQCPHCGHLWNATLPLQNKVKFVWMPVSFLSAKSLPQGAALLAAADPAQAMSAHEQLLLSGQGGMSASASVPQELEQAIKTNTQLLDSLGVDSVPFIVAKHAGTGRVVTSGGAMDTGALADLLGVDRP
ncbi:DsbC family protein [Hydrogenophaga sp.]|uniref:DsbC family protein n=1 Tax=Hydrogenophaga sp. TaxID=1904254 RepID=UPI0035696D97